MSNHRLEKLVSELRLDSKLPATVLEKIRELDLPLYEEIQLIEELRERMQASWNLLREPVLFREKR